MPGLYYEFFLNSLSLDFDQFFANGLNFITHGDSLLARITIKQEETSIFTNEWLNPPDPIISNPYSRIILAAGKPVTCRFTFETVSGILLSSTFTTLDSTEGGPIKIVKIICPSFTTIFSKLATLILYYQVIPLDTRVLKTIAASETLLDQTPSYQLLISNRLADYPLDDAFFYHDQNMVLLAELEAREKESSLLVAPDFIPSDVFKEIIEHYTLEPVVDPEPSPDPIDEIATDSVWDRICNAVKAGQDTRAASSLIVANMLDDPATVVSIGGTSYKREANYAMALSNPVPRAMATSGNLAHRSSVAGKNILIHAGTLSTLGHLATAVKPGFSFTETGVLKVKEKKYLFTPFCHSRTDAFIRKLSTSGLDGFLDRNSQKGPDSLSFKADYRPNSEQVFLKKGDIPQNIAAFDFGGAYSQYNWELFYHIPMMIAGKLARDQKFEQAQKWYHCIFDPTASETGGKQRFWQFLPFFQEAGKQVQTLNELMEDGAAVLQQINLWEKNPFKPHIIARMRVSAYMKNVVMKYLDCLIGWADSLFMRETLESINEATNLYILAAKILGPRPERVPTRAEPVDQTYNTLKDEKWLPLTNALVEIENFIPPSAGMGSHSWHYDIQPLHHHAVKVIETMLYFSIIRNDKLMAYWDKVADRLFKIRHSMNIEGIERTLALFEPPIDPALLVKAAAAGLDLGTVLDEVSGAASPAYRFTFMLQKARQFAEELKLLGHDLLGYLEKRDAEGLALLRQNQDIKIMESIKSIRQANVEEAKKRAVSIKKSLDAAIGRRKFFSERTLTNDSEKGYLNSLQSALDDIGTQKITETIASIVAAIPDFKIGAPTSVGTTFGGSNLAKATMAIASYYSGGVGQSNIEGARAAAMGGYERRMDDWKMQADSTKKEVEQLENELLITGIRCEVSERELSTHILHTENSREILDYMTRMFTAQELYEWLIGEVSAIYFQSYQLAVRMARKAQLCYIKELNESSAAFIGFSYWDSLKKGLMAAGRLVSDINMMEAAYIDNNKRKDFELTKNISLGLLDPVRLIELKTAGSARFNIPELLFDLDYPGHYLRRIKAVSVSLHCVTGPFTTVNATLRLIRHYTRTSLESVANDFYALKPEDYQAGGIQSIATSTAQNDSGLFICNFDDDRYLPFEGCGAAGEWEVVLVTNPGLRQFDYSTISDVVLHMKYTARENVAAHDTIMDRMTAELEKIAGQSLPLYSFINARTEMSSEWYAFLHPLPGAVNSITVPLDNNIFPYFTRTGKTIICNIGLYTIVKAGASVSLSVSCRQDGELTTFDASLPADLGNSLFEQTFALPGTIYLADIDEGKLLITSDTSIQPQDLADLIMTVQYRIEP